MNTPETSSVNRNIAIMVVFAIVGASLLGLATLAGVAYFDGDVVLPPDHRASDNEASINHPVADPLASPDSTPVDPASGDESNSPALADVPR